MHRKRVAERCIPFWDPEASTIYSRIRNRNTTLPCSFNHLTDAVIQRSYVTPRVYHEVDLSSAKSKLPDFSGSPSEDEPPEDEDIEKPEAEPRMLLQPDIRPISHERLIAKAKGIYAGLVMFEARCIAEDEKYIDINERQSPTAQGKGTPKSIHLKNDLRQSLIALHTRNLVDALYRFERQSPTAQGKGTPKSIHLKDDQRQLLTALHTRDLVDALYRSERTIEERKADEPFDMYSYIINILAMFRQIGVFAAVANIAALFEYGKAKRRIPTPINTKQPDPAFPKSTGESYDPLPEEFVMRGQLYSQCSFPETWFTDTTIGDDERSSEVPSMSQARIDRLLWLGRRLASLSWCVDYTHYPFRVREPAASMSKAARQKRLSVKFSLLVPLIAFLLPTVSGNPIDNPAEVDATSNIVPSVPLLAESLYVLFAATALVTAHLLAAKKGPIRVWACMMGISAYGWWAVRNDETALQSLSITGLIVWAISTFQYGIATFQEFRIPERVLLITVLGAAVLDMAIVSFITPKGTPISQSDLLSLSLPAMSLSLAVTANVFACFRDPPPSPPPDREIEARLSMDRGDRYYAGSFHQRSNTTYPSTSRPPLYSPLRTPSANGRSELPAA